MATPVISIALTSPNGSYTATTHPLRVTVTGSINEASVLTAEYSNENVYSEVSTSPLQNGSKVLFTRNGDIVYRGRVRQRGVAITDELTSHTFEAQCAIGDLARAACYLNSAHIGSWRCDTLQLTNVAMQPLVAGSLYYYPDPAITTTAYYPVSGTPRSVYASVAAGGWTNSATTLATSSTSDELMLREGILKCGTEYIAYSGYGYNTTSGAYVFYVITGGRGALGSTAASHAGSADAAQVFFNRIYPYEEPGTEIHVYDGGVEILPAGYTVNYEQGRIELAAAPAGAVTATYKIWDETAADGLVLGGDATYGVVDKILTGGWANGAPQFDGGSGRPSYQCSFSAGVQRIDKVHIPEVKLSAPVTAKKALDEIIEQYQYASVIDGCCQRPMMYWFDHVNNELIFAVLYQLSHYIAYSTVSAIQKHASCSYTLDSSNVYTDAVIGYDPSNGVHVATTNSSVTDITGVFDPTNYTKYRASGGGGATPSAYCFNAGAVTVGLAAGVGATAIRNGYKLTQTRTYQFSDVRSWYWVGDVITFYDGFKGQVVGATYTYDAGGETMTLTAVEVD